MDIKSCPVDVHQNVFSYKFENINYRIYFRLTIEFHFLKKVGLQEIIHQFKSNVGRTSLDYIERSYKVLDHRKNLPRKGIETETRGTKNDSGCRDWEVLKRKVETVYLHYFKVWITQSVLRFHPIEPLSVKHLGC